LRRRKKDKRKEKIQEIITRGGEPNIELPQRKRKRDRDLQLGEQRVVIDCAFDELMNDSEIGSLSSQLVYCHAKNRQLEKGFQVFWTSFSGRLKEALQNVPGWSQWKIEKTDVPYIEYFSKEKENLVYLTADTDNVLHTLDPKKIYIIGGLVDKNRHKGLCAKKAAEQGIAMARLPLEEHIQINSRKVITVNQIFEILTRVSSSLSASNDERSIWYEALDAVVPQRKKKLLSEEGSEEGEPPKKRQKTSTSTATREFTEDDGEGDYSDGDGTEDQ